MKLFHTAWRNIWRNGGRTLLSAGAIFASTLVMCLLFSFETGYIDDMRNNIRNHVTGDIRIMEKDYVENERIMPLQFFIGGTGAILERLNATAGIRLATPRTEFGVSIYRNGGQIPCRAVGIDFASSPIMKGVNNRLVSGTVPASRSTGVLVSPELADELALEPGDRFTAITRTAIGGSNGKTFTVSGILSMSDSDFTGRLFFLDWQTAGEYLRMGGNALQIQVFLDDRDALDAGVRLASSAAAGPEGSGDLEIIAWHDISGMYGFLELAGVIYAIYGCIFYLLASTVIFNTMMMSVLERKREIGTLAALGMERGRILRLFLAEAGLIACIGTVAGLLAGGILVTVWGRIGFDILAIYGTDMKGFGFSRVIYPSLNAGQYLNVFITGTVISVAACFLPARIASKVEPAEALADR
jgi:ABC-type transport system, involved in lipoprotein release, permease component